MTAPDPHAIARRLTAPMRRALLGHHPIWGVSCRTITTARRLHDAGLIQTLARRSALTPLGAQVRAIVEQGGGDAG